MCLYSVQVCNDCYDTAWTTSLQDGLQKALKTALNSKAWAAQKDLRQSSCFRRAWHA